MKRFVMYRRNVPTTTHNDDQRNAPDEPQFEGVVFDDGKVAIRWLTAKRSTSCWDSMDDMLAIHGHPEYGSELVWLDSNGGLPMTFVEMLRAVLADRDSTLASAAQSLGISPPYLHDLKEGRRLPSVEMVEKICAWMGRGPKGRLEWHLAGAEAHGWKVRP